MSKHKMVDGRLLQMNKSYGQLKTKQKEKIVAWIWIPDYMISRRRLWFTASLYIRAA